MTGFTYFSPYTSGTTLKSIEQKPKTLFKNKDANITISNATLQDYPTPADYWSAWMQYTQDEKLQTQMETVIQYFQDC